MNFLLELFNRLLRLFSPPIPGKKPPAVLEDNTTEPARIITTRVLLVTCDPIMDPETGLRLSRKFNWNRVENLTNEFISDIFTLSGGLARFQIVQRIVQSEFPELIDGFRYDATSFMKVQNGELEPHQPMMANYQRILTSLNVLQRIASRDIDEIWIFNFPYGGLHESVMGGEGAFWCNASPLTYTAGCQRKFIIMGFNFERGVGEMLEAFSHRAESLLGKTFNCQDFIAWAYKSNRIPATVGGDLNPFQRYLCFDQIAPGKSGLGTIHYAPNSVLEYEWDNPRLVMSACDDWYLYPKLKGDFRQVGPAEWGSSLRSHHEWWLRHLPRAPGRTDGIVHNWWQYIMDPNLVPS